MFLHSPDSIPTSCSRALFNYYGYTLVLDHRTKELQLENAETMRRKPAMSSIAGAFLLVLCLCASIPVQGRLKSNKCLEWKKSLRLAECWGTNVLLTNV